LGRVSVLAGTMARGPIPCLAMSQLVTIYRPGGLVIFIGANIVEGQWDGIRLGS
jgi:hypothetical protein